MKWTAVMSFHGGRQWAFADRQAGTGIEADDLSSAVSMALTRYHEIKPRRGDFEPREMAILGDNYQFRRVPFPNA